MAGNGRGRRPLFAVLSAVAVAAVCFGIAVGPRLIGDHGSRPSTAGLPLAIASGGSSSATPASSVSGSTAKSRAAHPSHAPDSAPYSGVPPAPGAGAPISGVAPAPTKSGPVVTRPAPPPRPTNSSHTVYGEVSCSSGRPVVGIWVHGDVVEGWASLKTIDGGPNTAYSYTFPAKQSYSLHVGCGEDADHQWLHGPHTTTVSGTYNSFNCFDVPGAADYDTCAVRPKS